MIICKSVLSIPPEYPPAYLFAVQFIDTEPRSTPKAFHNKAQGCDVRIATLGYGERDFPTLQGLHIAHTNGLCNRFAVTNHIFDLTQGGAASTPLTLGCAVERLRRKGEIKFSVGIPSVG